ncbi:DNA-binding CsgD family transcriptional regulator [Mycobacterium sp. MAA66]|uniref:helix-turn-helix transcriptional regulator n=1 Tax=Mycobacterium sp. MAA66 TaxID=3156297 RepID=UPI003516E346
MVTSTDWPFVGRGNELAALSRMVADPSARGVVLAGPAGVGKTRLATECAAAAKDCAVARVAGHQSSAQLPFGALTHLLPSVDHGEEAMRQDRAGLLRQFADALIKSAGSRRLLLLVDDAHLLDMASATLIHQLALTGSAFVLATVRAGEVAPDAVVALWKDGLIERHEVVGLPIAATERLICAALDGVVDPDTTLTLATHCHGNVLFLRELVLGAVEDRTLRYEHGMWRLARPLRPSSRLVELVESRLGELGPDERALMELVSLGEPLGQRELETLGDADVAERLERAGLVRVEVNNGHLQVRLGHPVYGDVLRAGLPVLRVASISRALAESVEASGTANDEEVLRIGSWRLIGGGGSPQVMLAAATAARWRYDFPLAQRLVQAARDLGGGFDADLLAARLSGIQGRSDAAESELAVLAELATDDAQRAKVTIARMDNFLYSDRPGDSLQVATAAETTIRDRHWRDEIVARRSAILVATDGPLATLKAVTPLLAGSTSNNALVWACLTGARSLARMGRCQEALQLTERGYATQIALTEPIEWYPWFHLFNRCEALLNVGRLHDAEALARAEYTAGLRDHSPEAQGCFALQLAKVCLLRGRVRDAATHAREAVAVLRRIGRPMFLHEALHILAMARAHTDEIEAANTVLAKIDEFDLPRRTYDAADALVARAWMAAAQAHLPQARKLADDAAQLALKSGDLVVASVAMHTQARFGAAAEVTEALDRLERRIDPGLVNPLAAHARHLAGDNPEGLQDAATAFAELGADLLAADAAADSAVSWTRHGHQRNAAAATRMAVDLAEACQGATTPALQSINARARLTPAEHETAALAASGLSNKAIADELVLSVRSVENRLQRVYEKLGISSRAALPLALNISTRRPPHSDAEPASPRPRRRQSVPQPHH